MRFKFIGTYHRQGKTVTHNTHNSNGGVSEDAVYGSSTTANKDHHRNTTPLLPWVLPLIKSSTALFLSSSASSRSSGPATFHLSFLQQVTQRLGESTPCRSALTNSQRHHPHPTMAAAVVPHCFSLYSTQGVDMPSNTSALSSVVRTTTKGVAISSSTQTQPCISLEEEQSDIKEECLTIISRAAFAQSSSSFSTSTSATFPDDHVQEDLQCLILACDLHRGGGEDCEEVGGALSFDDEHLFGESTRAAAASCSAFHGMELISSSSSAMTTLMDDDHHHTGKGNNFLFSNTIIAAVFSQDEQKKEAAHVLELIKITKEEETRILDVVATAEAACYPNDDACSHHHQQQPSSHSLSLCAQDGVPSSTDISSRDLSTTTEWPSLPRFPFHDGEEAKEEVFTTTEVLLPLVLSGSHGHPPTSQPPSSRSALQTLLLTTNSVEEDCVVGSSNELSTTKVQDLFFSMSSSILSVQQLLSREAAEVSRHHGPAAATILEDNTADEAPPLSSSKTVSSSLQEDDDNDSDGWPIDDHVDYGCEEKEESNKYSPISTVWSSTFADADAVKTPKRQQPSTNISTSAMFSSLFSAVAPPPRSSMPTIKQLLDVVAGACDAIAPRCSTTEFTCCESEDAMLPSGSSQRSNKHHHLLPQLPRQWLIDRFVRKQLVASCSERRENEMLFLTTVVQNLDSEPLLASSEKMDNLAMLWKSSPPDELLFDLPSQQEKASQSPVEEDRAIAVEPSQTPWWVHATGDSTIDRTMTFVVASEVGMNNDQVPTTEDISTLFKNDVECCSDQLSSAAHQLLAIWCDGTLNKRHERRCAEAHMSSDRDEEGSVAFSVFKRSSCCQEDGCPLAAMESLVSKTLRMSLSSSSRQPTASAMSIVAVNAPCDFTPHLDNNNHDKPQNLGCDFVRDAMVPLVLSVLHQQTHVGSNPHSVVVVVVPSHFFTEAQELFAVAIIADINKKQEVQRSTSFPTAEASSESIFNVLSASDDENEEDMMMDNKPHNGDYEIGEEMKLQAVESFMNRLVLIPEGEFEAYVTSLVLRSRLHSQYDHSLERTNGTEAKEVSVATAAAAMCSMVLVTHPTVDLNFGKVATVMVPAAPARRPNELSQSQRPRHDRHAVTGLPVVVSSTPRQDGGRPPEASDAEVTSYNLVDDHNDDDPLEPLFAAILHIACETPSSLEPQLSRLLMDSDDGDGATKETTTTLLHQMTSSRHGANNNDDDVDDERRQCTPQLCGLLQLASLFSFSRAEPSLQRVEALVPPPAPLEAPPSQQLFSQAMQVVWAELQRVQRTLGAQLVSQIQYHCQMGIDRLNQYRGNGVVPPSSSSAHLEDENLPSPFATATSLLHEARQYMLHQQGSSTAHVVAFALEHVHTLELLCIASIVDTNLGSAFALVCLERGANLLAESFSKFGIHVTVPITATRGMAILHQVIAELSNAVDSHQQQQQSGAPIPAAQPSSYLQDCLLHAIQEKRSSSSGMVTVVLTASTQGEEVSLPEGDKAARPGAAIFCNTFHKELSMLSKQLSDTMGVRVVLSDTAELSTCISDARHRLEAKAQAKLLNTSCNSMKKRSTTATTTVVDDENDVRTERSDGQDLLASFGVFMDCCSRHRATTFVAVEDSSSTSVVATAKNMVDAKLHNGVAILLDITTMQQLLEEHLLLLEERMCEQMSGRSQQKACGGVRNCGGAGGHPPIADPWLQRQLVELLHPATIIVGDLIPHEYTQRHEQQHSSQYNLPPAAAATTAGSGSSMSFPLLDIFQRRCGRPTSSWQDHLNQSSCGKSKGSPSVVIDLKYLLRAVLAHRMEYLDAPTTCVLQLLVAEEHHKMPNEEGPRHQQHGGKVGIASNAAAGSAQPVRHEQSSNHQHHPPSVENNQPPPASSMEGLASFVPCVFVCESALSQQQLMMSLTQVDIAALAAAQQQKKRMENGKSSTDIEEQDETWQQQLVATVQQEQEYLHLVEAPALPFSCATLVIPQEAAAAVGDHHTTESTAVIFVNADNLRTSKQHQRKASSTHHNNTHPSAGEQPQPGGCPIFDPSFLDAALPLLAVAHRELLVIVDGHAMSLEEVEFVMETINALQTEGVSLGNLKRLEDGGEGQQEKESQASSIPAQERQDQRPSSRTTFLPSFSVSIQWVHSPNEAVNVIKRTAWKAQLLPHLQQQTEEEEEHHQQRRVCTASAALGGSTTISRAEAILLSFPGCSVADVLSLRHPERQYVVDHHPHHHPHNHNNNCNTVGTLLVQRLESSSSMRTIDRLYSHASFVAQ